jgi:hypothetical protein
MVKDRGGRRGVENAFLSADRCFMADRQFQPCAMDDQVPTDLSLAPLDQQVTEIRKLHGPQPVHPPPLPEPPSSSVRYSLGELLALITVSALLLAPIRYLGAALFAAASGALAFIVLVYISLAKPSRGIVHVAWWVLLVIYIVAAVAALLNRDL